MKTQSILGVTLTNTTESEILEYVFETLIQPRRKAYIVTPNPEMVTYAATHPDFKTILNKAEIALPDGVGLLIAGQLLGKPLQQRITGVDCMQNLCKESVRKTVRIGLLGGKSGVAEKAADRLRKMYPGITIVFAAAEWEDNVPTIDLLFVALGHPKQEQWMSENLAHIPVTVAMGVGGAFDYLSGDVIRAPQFVRMVGLEWLFRLIRQPWRLKRQVALLKFGLLVMKERTRR
jgi:N-acetylglucosaminyldiphosphoundecaprenol N-acetyl-beta-D-mannosaminyltransferase